MRTAAEVPRRSGHPQIEAFRGFNQRQRIELDASAIVVLGPNGTGKTSFFDAVQWLLLGTLQRLERWRVRKNDEHIVNRYRVSDSAVVEAEVEVGGRLVRLRRQGRYNKGLLEWHDDAGTVRGDDAERRLAEALTSRPGQDFRQLLMSSALLQQDVVREVLEDKPPQRYQQLSALLGLDELGSFEDELDKRTRRLAAAGDAARQSLQAAQSRVEQQQLDLQALESNLQLANDVRAVRSEIEARIDNVRDVVRLDQMRTTSAEAALLQNAAQVTGERLRDLVVLGRQLSDARAALAPPAEDEVVSARQAVETAEAAVSAADETLSEAERRLTAATERSSQMTALAVAALDLLGPTCPVCGQAIDQHEVEHQLHDRISTSSADDLTSMKGDVDAARAGAAEARRQLDERRQAYAPVASALAQAQELEKSYEEWAVALGDFEVPGGSALRLVDIGAIRATDLSAADGALSGLRVVWTAMGELVAVLRSDTADAQVTAARASLRRAEEVLPGLREDARIASEKEEKSRTLQRAATRAVVAVSQQRFRRLLPTVQDIYLRLDPHPSFKAFDFELEVYRQRGIATPIVRDTHGSVEGDPLLMFSSSQANVVALSYFLALGWAAGRDALPFVLLDDPLQSMDDVNALGFADLCRHIRRQRQLIVSTHERRLGGLLQRKLAPRAANERTRVIEFRAWTRDGPTFDQAVVPPQVEEGARRSLVAA